MGASMIGIRTRVFTAASPTLYDRANLLSLQHKGMCRLVGIPRFYCVGHSDFL